MKVFSFFALCVMGIQFAACADVVITRDLTPIPPGEIQSVVKECMDKVAKGDESGLAGLKMRADEALPSLETYLDGNDETLYAVSFVASASSSPKAMEMLGKILDKGGDMSSDSSLKFLWHYKRETIRQSEALKPILLRRFIAQPDDARSLILLSCFDTDPQEVKSLQEIKRTKGNRLTQIAFQPRLPKVKLTYALDVFFKQTGVAPELEIEAGKTNVLDIEFLLYSVRFLDNSDINKQVLTLLTDKRPALEIEFGGDTIPPISRRVADLAFDALRAKSMGRSYVDFWATSIYTDEILAKAPEQFAATSNVTKTPQ